MLSRVINPSRKPEELLSSFLSYRVSTLVCWAPAWKVDGLEGAILLIRTLEKLDSDTKKMTMLLILFQAVFEEQKDNKVEGEKNVHQNIFCFGHFSTEWVFCEISPCVLYVSVTVAVFCRSG